jgi:integral membrane sensor domain MASE1
MRTTALIVVALALASGLVGLYATQDEGVQEIMTWLFLVLLGVAALLVFAHLGMRDKWAT